MKLFQENLIKLREKQNLSQEVSSKLLSFSCEQLKELEEGKREPTADELVAISKFYKISIDKLLKQKKKDCITEEYKVKRQQLVGYNRYGMKQGWSVIAVPVMAFIALCLMFVPGFNASNGVGSLMKLLFSTNNFFYLTLGILSLVVLGFEIIYWSVLLALSNYARARLKVLNNVFLCVFAGLSLVVTIIIMFLFTDRVSVGGIITYIMLLANVVTQIILLIAMNLEGGDFSRDEVYTYHEVDVSGYETKHWFMLGISIFALLSLCLMFVIAFDGVVWLKQIHASMFDALFEWKGNFISVGLGVICVLVLVFNVVYWIIACALPRSARRKMNTANNVLAVVMSIVLFVDTVAIMSVTGFEYFTVGGIFFYISIYLTSIYGLCTLPIVNSRRKSVYVEDEKGLHKVKTVQGQKPGKIMAYKFSVLAQYLMVVLIGASIGLSFLDSTLRYVAFVSGLLLILQIVFLCLQHGGRYVNVSVFIFGIILNTAIGLFNLYLLALSFFGGLTLGAKIALPITSGFTILLYLWIAFTLKPIRDASEEL